MHYFANATHQFVKASRNYAKKMKQTYKNKLNGLSYILTKRVTKYYATSA